MVVERTTDQQVFLRPITNIPGICSRRVVFSEQTSSHNTFSQCFMEPPFETSCSLAD